MNRFVNKISGLVLILTGIIVFMFTDTLLYKIIKSAWFHILLLIYCILQYYFASVKKNYIKIYLSAFFFMVSVVLFAVSNYEILNIDKLIILSSYIIPGVSFLFLFVNNTKEKMFLNIATTWIVLGGVLFYFLSDYFLLVFITNLINVFITTLPLLAVSLGILNLLKKKK